MKTPTWTRTALAAALLGGAALGATGARPARADGPDAERIALADFKKEQDAGRVLVLDVRGAETYAMGHIPGALSIPLETLPQHLKELKAEKRPIVTYCS